MDSSGLQMLVMPPACCVTIETYITSTNLSHHLRQMSEIAVLPHRVISRLK